MATVLEDPYLISMICSVKTRDRQTDYVHLWNDLRRVLCDAMPYSHTCQNIVRSANKADRGKIIHNCLQSHGPLPSIRQHLNFDDCLEDKREDCRNSPVLYCVLQLYTVIRRHVLAVTVNSWFRFSFAVGLLFVSLFLSFCSCMLAFVSPKVAQR